MPQGSDDASGLREAGAPRGSGHVAKMPTAVKWVDCVQRLSPGCLLVAPANGCSLPFAPDQVERPRCAP